MFVAGRRRLHRRDRDVRRRRSPASSSTKYPRDAAHRRRASSSVVSDLTDVPGAQRTSRRPATRCRRPTTSRPPDIQALDGQPRRHGALNIVFRTGPAALDDRAVVVREIRDDDATRPTGIRATPSGLAVVGVGLLDNLEANRDPAHLPRDPLRVPVPRRPAPQRHPVAAVARAGADRRRRRVAVRVRARPQAQPDDRGRRPARGRGVHRVHVADPAAVRRGAPARARAPRGGRRRPRRGPAARSSCRRSPPSPASRCIVVRRRCRCCATSAGSSPSTSPSRCSARWSCCRRCWCGPTSATGCRGGLLGKQPEPFIPTPPMGQGTAAAAGAPSET